MGFAKRFVQRQRVERRSLGFRKRVSWSDDSVVAKQGVELVGHSFREVFLFRIAGQVVERQNGQRPDPVRTHDGRVTPVSRAHQQREHRQDAQR